MTQERPSERPPGPEGMPQRSSARDAAEQAIEAREPHGDEARTIDRSGHPPAALRSLRQAMRRARWDDAERLGAICDLRVARIGRLELLEEALQPLVEQIPEDVDLFDVGLMPGGNPRLFLDMIGFFEMARDARIYRLVQDTRHGRRVLAESDSIPHMVGAATDYVARRLLERDKALAADGDGDAGGDIALGARRRAAPDITEPVAAKPRRRRARSARIFGAAFAILIDLLGAIAFFGILFGLAWFVWQRAHGQA